MAAPVRDSVKLDAVGELHFSLPSGGERTKLALRLSGMVAVLLGLLCYCTLSMEWRTRKRLKFKLGVSIFAGHMHNSIRSDLCCCSTGDVSCRRKAWGEGEGVIGREGEHSQRSAWGSPPLLRSESSFRLENFNITEDDDVNRNIIATRR